jgi:hypothetical protein
MPDRKNRAKTTSTDILNESAALLRAVERFLNRVLGRNPEVSILPKHNHFHLRPYRDEPSASRPIRADKHRRGQRVLTWVTSREHCAAAGNFFSTSQQPTKQDRPQVAQVGSFDVLVVSTLLCVSFDL